MILLIIHNVEIMINHTWCANPDFINHTPNTNHDSINHTSCTNHDSFNHTPCTNHDSINHARCTNHDSINHTRCANHNYISPPHITKLMMVFPIWLIVDITYKHVYFILSRNSNKRRCQTGWSNWIHVRHIMNNSL